MIAEDPSTTPQQFIAIGPRVEMTKGLPAFSRQETLERICEP